MTPATLATLRRRRPAALTAAMLAGGLALSLAACAPPPVDSTTQTGSVPDDYHVAHPILIQDEVATLDVPVAPNATGLTDATRSNIMFFAQRFRDSHTSVIAVVAPSGSPNQVAAAAVAVQIEDLLRQSGIDPRAVDYRVYRATADQKIAPVRVAYNRITATTAPCGDFSDQLGASYENKNFRNFGCATQQNLAAIVDSPLDLLYPRGLSPADAARRAEVLSKYRLGQPFGSDSSQFNGGTVATGVGTP